MPETLLLKVEAGIVVSAHTVKFSSFTTVGLGFMVIVNDEDGPVQLFTVGVTVMVAIIGAVVLFMAVKPDILELPLAAKPISGFEFVQLIVAPEGVLLKIVSDTREPSQ